MRHGVGGICAINGTDKIIIEVRDVSFSYERSRSVFTGLDIDIRKGFIISLLGANGSGKTTLLHLLNGLLKPSAGKITYAAEFFPHDAKAPDIFRQVGLVFQNPDDQLVELTVKEDVGYGPANLGIKGEKLEAVIAEAMELTDISGLAGRNVHTLSYGQKKRVALAGVMAMEPAVLLLDEPTAGLDPVSCHKLMNTLVKLRDTKGVSVVMATHDVDMVPIFSDEVFLLRDGKTAAEGQPQEVFGQKELLRECGLRLPRIAHLMEILQEHDGLEIDSALTIAQARKAILKAVGRA